MTINLVSERSRMLTAATRCMRVLRLGWERTLEDADRVFRDAAVLRDAVERDREQTARYIASVKVLALLLAK